MVKSEIKTTINVLVTAEMALKQVIALNPPQAKLRYHLARLGGFVADITKFATKDRDRLFIQYSTVRDTLPQEVERLGPKTREIPDGTPEHVAYMAAIQDLQEQEVTIPWGPVRSSDLPGPDTPCDACAKAKPHVTLAQIIALGPLCELVDPEEGAADGG